jgi:hypothetical protein
MRESLLVQNYYTPTSVRRGVCKNYLYKILRECSQTGTAQRDRSLACHRRSNTVADSLKGVRRLDSTQPPTGAATCRELALPPARTRHCVTRAQAPLHITVYLMTRLTNKLLYVLCWACDSEQCPQYPTVGYNNNKPCKFAYATAPFGREAAIYQVKVHVILYLPMPTDYFVTSPKPSTALYLVRTTTVF